MSRIAHLIALSLCAAALAGCGERAQIGASKLKKADAKPWESASTDYTDSGWKAGDETSWQAQIRTRNQSQNEYQRTGSVTPAK
ncbi:MAG: hypothetical protein CFE46_12805 [Burkholderiales bacterium PBB6]|nr:MAG: hypothetical protein CFE46_12805 [Burkholderiales bacterium PBB6]